MADIKLRPESGKEKSFYTLNISKRLFYAGASFGVAISRFNKKGKISGFKIVNGGL